MKSSLWRYCVICFCSAAVATSQAATYTSVKAGFWDDPTVWGGILGGPVPGASDTAILNHSVHTSVGSTAQNVTVNSTGELFLQSEDFPLNGGLLTLHGILDVVGHDMVFSNGADMYLGATGTYEYIAGGALRFQTGSCGLSGAAGAEITFSDVTVDAGCILNGSTVDWTVDGTLYLYGQVTGKGPIYGSIGELQYLSGGNRTNGAEWTPANYPVVWLDNNTSLGLSGTGLHYDTYGVTVNAGSTFSQLTNDLDATFFGIQNSGTYNLGSNTVRLYDASNLDNNGVFNGGTGKVTFDTGPFQGGITGTVTIYDLVVDGILVRNFDALTIGHSLTVKSADGEFYGDTPAIFAPGATLNYENTDVNPFESTDWGSGTTSATGAPTEVTLSTSTVALSNGQVVATDKLHIGAASTLFVVDATVNISTQLQIDAGGTLNVGSFGVVNSPPNVIEAKQVAATGSYSFPFNNVTLNVTSLPAGSGQITVEQHGSSYPGSPAGIQTGKWWDITPTVACTASISLPTSGLAGGADPYVCHYNSGLATWDYARDSVGGGYVTRNAVTNFSPFAVGDLNLGPLPVTVSVLQVE